MLREAFYYLLGGVTFLPLCVVAVVLHIYLYAPSVHQNPGAGVASDVELTHETKLAALDLAAKNAAIHEEIEKSQGKDLPQGNATVPPTAKRLGPKPASTTTSLKPFSSGWLTVRSKFDSDKDTAAAASPATTSLAAQSTTDDALTPQDLADPDSQTESGEGASTLNKAMNNSSGYMSQMYRGILDYRIGKPGAKKPTSDQPSRTASSSSAASSTPTGTAGRENFYCILKAPILYLYSSDDVSNPNTECHAAIDLRGKRVSIFVAGLGDTLGEMDGPSQHKPETDTEGDEAEPTPAQQGWKKAKRAIVRDGELFMKRNAIRIVGSASGRSRSPAPTEDQTSRAGRNRRRPQWFIFCKNNYHMEDWYHALIQSSLMPEAGLGVKNEEIDTSHLPPAFKSTDDPVGPIFSREDMASLLVSLDNLTDPLPLRWLNALVGRIFFSIYRTAWLENYITSKMMKKLSRVKTPGFLGDIKVEEVDVGRRAPAFSRPMLKALTDEGEASMEIALHYVGEIRITISTTLSFSLGSRFKPYNIPIVLAVVLRSLEGNLLLHVKPPPSNRLWFGFTAMPKLELDVEPVVSERKVQWGMVTRLIESRLRELLIESIVVPNMDDMPFFDTRSFFFRGGIFADAVKDPEPASSAAAAVAASATSAAAEEASAPAQSLISGLKPSDANVLPNTTANSAPVSGVATPISLAGGDGENIDAASSGDADSTNSASRIETALRNRKAGANPPPASSLSNRMSSPAVAGLSDLLSRDLAAGGGSNAQHSTSSSPPRQDSKSTAAKRKMWFGASPRTSTSSTPSSGLSALGLAAGSLGGRGHREQGSLALGNASIERPGNRSNSVAVPDRTGDLDVQRPSMSRPRSATVLETSATGQAVADRPMASSVETAPSPLSVDTYGRADAMPLSAANDAVPQDRKLDEIEDTAQRPRPPSVLVSDVSQIEGTGLPSSASSPPSLDINKILRASVLTDAAKELVNSPASLTHSNKSPASSLRHEELEVAEPVQADGSSAFGTGQSAQNLQEPASSAASTRSDRSLDLSGDSKLSSARSTQYGFAPPPPPPRRPAPKASPVDEKSRYHQDAAAALSNVQKNRYGLGDGSRDVGEDTSGTGPALTSAALWNKAKASMADKESRQAAAKEAKDAIKRGWSSWNAKRAEAKRGQQNETEYTSTMAHDSMTRSHASRMSLVPGQSAWLASSPPDPTSFGLGFDKASPEDKRSDHILPALPPYARHNVGDTDDDGGSTHSGSSGRKPYRDYRALRRSHPHDDHGQSLPSAPHSPLVSAPDPAPNPHDDASPSAVWAAKTPSIPAPAAAASQTDEGGKVERQNPAADSTPPRTQPEGAAAERPTPPRRKISTSISSSGSSSGISFIPAAPSATTSLASTAGFPSPVPQEPSSTHVSDEKANALPAREQQESTSEGQASMGAALAPISSRTPSGSFRTLPADVSPRAEDTSLPDIRDPLSTATSSGIKKQPGRAAMMAVPGIPSMQKAGPQSFSAPPPPPSAAANASPSLRRTSLFKLPSFGSPSGTPLPLPAEPTAAPAEQVEAAKADELPLGLTDEQSAVKAAQTKAPPVVAQADESESFASVAKADGPSADPSFEEALMDRGTTVHIGDTTAKLADGSRTEEQIRPSIPTTDPEPTPATEH